MERWVPGFQSRRFLVLGFAARERINLLDLASRGSLEVAVNYIYLTRTNNLVLTGVMPILGDLWFES